MTFLSQHMYMSLYMLTYPPSSSTSPLMFLTQLPEVHPSSKLLLPPPAISHYDSGWPLLTVAKGFFEGHMKMKGIGLLSYSNLHQLICGYKSA